MKHTNMCLKIEVVMYSFELLRTEQSGKKGTIFKNPLAKSDSLEFIGE